MNQEYNLLEFLLQIKKWKKELLIGSLSIFLLSIIGSLLLPNYYKAETTFYAASPDLAKPLPIGGAEKDVRIYGDDNDLDRLFTLASSHEVLFHLIDSFDLYQHYNIKKTDKKAIFKVREKLLNNYQTIKTKYGALLLIVEDKSPEMAANLANSARDKIANLAQSIIKDSQGKLAASFEASINRKQVISDSLGAKLLKIKEEAGIFDSRQLSIYTNILTEASSELEDAKGKIAFYKKYPSLRDTLIRYMAKEEGAKSKKFKAMSELEKYSPIMSEVRQYEQEQGRIYEQIALDKERLKQLSSSYAAPFTVLHLAEKAEIPVQKSRPKRSIIVIITTLLGVMLSFLAVFVFENISSVDLKKRN